LEVFGDGLSSTFLVVWPRDVRREASVFGLSATWIEFMLFTCEVQSVVLMRVLRLAQGGRGADVEARRMVVEKFDALAEAETAMADALLHGEELMVAAERAYAPVRRRVHANNRRLTRAAA
jgi:hypothetical protein